MGSQPLPKRLYAILALFVLILVSYQMLFYLPEHVSIEDVLPIDEAAEYRRLLSTVHPLDGLPHSKTLGVASRLYIIGLPGREDRHAVMESLERAMGRPITLNVPYFLLNCIWRFQISRSLGTMLQTCIHQ